VLNRPLKKTVQRLISALEPQEINAKARAITQIPQANTIAQHKLVGIIVAQEQFQHQHPIKQVDSFREANRHKAGN